MQNRHQPQKKKHRTWVRVIRWLFLAAIAVVLLGVGIFAWYAKDAPKVDQATLESDGSTILYDTAGKQFMTLGLQDRLYVKSNQIPTTLKDAVVSIEDRRFYEEHFGVDPLRIASAAFSNVLGKSNGLQGGSTLTQQLIKLSVFSTKTSDQTLRRKAQEAWLAMQVEQKYSKAQILEYYINKVYMNHGQYGMGTAAKYYYGKNLNQLSLPQIAFIAGLAQSPVGYDPVIHPQAATTRRNAVIAAMLRDKKITSAQASAATQTPIATGLIKQTDNTEAQTEMQKIMDPYLTSVVAEVKKKLKVNPYTAGLKIYTNVDVDAQRYLYNLVNSGQITFPSDQVQTAVTMTDPNTGAVIAQIGGRKLGDTLLGFNRATQNNRSNGSTMKPLMDYGPAIENLNWSTAQVLADTAYTYPGTSTQLYDWDKTYMGNITMRTALEQSRNVPAIRALSEVGMSKAVNFLKGLGINLPASQQVLSSGIGSSVTTEQEAAAYGAMANGGVYYEPSYITKVVTADGETEDLTSNGTRAMKSSTAYMLTDMLKGVLTKGTGTAAKVNSTLYEAGKTGTTDYSAEEIAQNPALGGTGIAKDSWFTGYTRNRVISVWTGYDKPLTGGLNYTQQTIAQQIYKALMGYTSQGLTNRDWTRPDNVLVRYLQSGSRELFLQNSPTSGIGATTDSQPTYSSSASVFTEPESSSSASSSSSESDSSSVSESSSSAPESSSEVSSSEEPTPPAGR
ncbi:PBP1A family penicillin-binding protein [Lacticaseibacillus brantae]|uniref:Membrane carboxypeptidase (Penicillin-binding protein) n=1 Tax=Lacticaseibacillus brantae DSM 23927 TaxID=1423727 RepID=A0A0R2B0A1_9LACO|nr:membrane carboxypeptidase (penicillin-binding protein) [Lacticaseibacillus brantae DSM 23927]